VDLLQGAFYFGTGPGNKNAPTLRPLRELAAPQGGAFLSWGGPAIKKTADGYPPFFYRATRFMPGFLSPAN
jgi:hypothetical protein